MDFLILVFVHWAIALDLVECPIHYQREVVVCYDDAVAYQLIVNLYCIIIETSMLVILNKNAIYQCFERV